MSSMSQQKPNPLQQDSLKHVKNAMNFDNLCITLQYAFIQPSKELLSRNYLNSKSLDSKTNPIGYHVPKLVFHCSSYLLRPSTYNEIVEERATAKLCGLPICANKLKKIPNDNKTYYRLDLHKKEIRQESDSYYCSNECSKKSIEFCVNLEDVAIQYKSEPLEKIKQALQLIFSWYTGKIRIKNQTQNEQTQNHQNKSMQINGIEEKMKNLKIIEKNVAFNLHQKKEEEKINKNDTEKPPKTHKKFKRPIGRREKEKQIKINENIINRNSSEKMEVDNGNKNDNVDIERLHHIALEEKRKLNENKKVIQMEVDEDKNDENENEDESKDEHKNKRKIKENKKMNKEETEKLEAERLQIERDEMQRSLYSSMSNNAQLMGHFISWCTDASSYLIMNDDDAYSKWKNKTLDVYSDSYLDPTLKSRQESLMNNVMKYIMGLLKKFEVNPILISPVCNQIHLLIDTFDVVSALPSYPSNVWCFIGFVFLKLISHRIRELKTEMFDKRETVKSVLKTIGFGEEYVSTLEQIVVTE